MRRSLATRDRFAAAEAPAPPLSSGLFRGDPELQAVADGKLRLGRTGDPQFPAPIRSSGRGVLKVQQALIYLGYPLGPAGAIGRYDNSTYAAVLAYKGRHNIRTNTGYLDGIVGPKTIAHLDAGLPRAPLLACRAGGGRVAVTSLRAPVARLAPALPGLTCDMGATVLTSPFLPRLDPGFVADPDLKLCIDGKIAGTSLANLRVALVDLSPEEAKPLYAGRNDDRQTFAASIPKITALFAAVHLRRVLRDASVVARSTTATAFIAEVEAAWRPIVRSCLKAGPPDFPSLDKIFDITPRPPGTEWDIRFRADGWPWWPPAGQVCCNRARPKPGESCAPGGRSPTFVSCYHNAYVPNLDRLKFQERMRLIVKNSNPAAASVIRDLGFQYIHCSLVQAGLYDLPVKSGGTGRGGLWLGADYGGRVWRADPVGGTVQSATARAIASYLTLLSQGRLVDATASREVEEILSNAGSWFSEWLTQQGRPHRLRAAKVGHSGSTIGDCILLERDVAPPTLPKPKTLRYAATGFGIGDVGHLRRLILALDDCIVARAFARGRARGEW